MTQTGSPASLTPSTGPVHVLLADDHAIFRQGLRVLLQDEGFDVIGEAATGPEALHMAETGHPDVVILDYNMPVMDGISVARELQKSAPAVQTVLLTVEEDNASAAEALRAGMHGYVYKSQSAEELISTVREVARGAIHFNTRLSAGALTSLTNQESNEPEPLTERERQVLTLIARGSTTRAIAKELGLSAKTVESHRGRIMQKLHVHRAAELIRYAIRHQLITP
jgi:DNA-binding NarL/FixJ family response regulator